MRPDRGTVRGLIACAVVLTGCSSSTSGGRPSAEQSVTCQVRRGQDCLGRLEPGTYHSRAFTPAITYTVPTGWANDMDTAGNFLLVPHGSGPRKADADQGDSIGVYASVALDKSCNSHHQQRLARSPRAYTRWLLAQPALNVMHAHPVILGGLHGTVQTLRLSRPVHACSWSQAPMFPYLVGDRPSTLVHVVSDKDAIRVYFLSTTYFGSKVVLGIEATAVHGRGLVQLDRVVRTFRFGRPL